MNAPSPPSEQAEIFLKIRTSIGFAAFWPALLAIIRATLIE